MATADDFLPEWDVKLSVTSHGGKSREVTISPIPFPTDGQLRLLWRWSGQRLQQALERLER